MCAEFATDFLIIFIFSYSLEYLYSIVHIIIHGLIIIMGYSITHLARAMNCPVDGKLYKNRQTP